MLIATSTMAFAQNVFANFDHEVTQPAPGGETTDGGPQAKSNITSVAGVPLVRLNNGVMMPRFGFGTQIQSMEGASRLRTISLRYPNDIATSTLGLCYAYASPFLAPSTSLATKEPKRPPKEHHRMIKGVPLFFIFGKT